MPDRRNEPRSPWPLEAWYVACTPDELDSGPLGRRICDEPMVIFRGDDGQVAILEDFCPHRGAPLSKGFLDGGHIVCGYHGMTFNCAGRAVAMVGQAVERLPSVRTFAALERHGFVWVWPGDAAKADPAALPDFFWSGNPAWVYGGGRFHIACDYRLMIDNLMDLTHETYVHATSIGQKEIEEAPVSTRIDGNEVVTERYMQEVDAPPFWRAALKGGGLPEDAKVDRWQVCRFSLPSHVMIEVGVALAGRGGLQAAPQDKVSSVVVDFITPETSTTHHYFWGMARSFGVEDAALTDTIRQGQGKIFSEDLAMLEGQQANLSRVPERRLLTLNIDAGGAHARRMIERRIGEEQASA